MAKITDIEGIGPAFAEKLAALEIVSVEAFLKKGATAAGREEIASKTDIQAGRVLRWVRMADLFRINGVSSQNAEMLLAAGITGIPALAAANAEALHAKMTEVNDEKKLVRVVSTAERLKGFIDQAKALDTVVSE